MSVSQSIKQWWPLASSLDLVCAANDVVASAVLTEVTRFTNERVSLDQVPFTSLHQIFDSTSAFTSVPTVFFVLPTCSDWTVLWNNSFLCDGYDSLCWCLTTNHGLTTLHWSCSDGDAVFQAGSSFTYRAQSGSELNERSVACCKNDGLWEFHAVGKPLPEEDLAAYSARRKRDRLNEQGVLKLLRRLGARPWEDDFYQPGTAVRIKRESYPNTISQKKFSEFACSKAEIKM